MQVSVVEARAQYLGLLGSRAEAQELWHTGLIAPPHVGSSQARDRTHASCMGRKIPYHWVTMELARFSLMCIHSHPLPWLPPPTKKLITTNQLCKHFKGPWDTSLSLTATHHKLQSACLSLPLYRLHTILCLIGFYQMLLYWNKFILKGNYVKAKCEKESLTSMKDTCKYIYIYDESK